MDAMDSDAWWKEQWPLGILLFGLLMLLLAVYGTFSGKLYGRGGVTDRAKDPSTYRVALIVQYLCAIALILYWLFALPHTLGLQQNSH
jgi:hypothetical protein